MSPARRRTAVEHLKEKFPTASERRRCRAAKQPRSTHRYEPSDKSEEQRLVDRMHALVKRHPRYGYRRVHALLRREGWRVNLKRIHRLWRKEGFRVPRKVRRKRLPPREQGVVHQPSQHANDVVCWDFVHDRDIKGRSLKFLTMEDEFTRENLEFEVGRSLNAARVVEIMAAVFKVRGAPKRLRSDNGPEMIAKELKKFLARIECGTLYIDPGCPWQNGYAESFNSKARDEFLQMETFTDVKDARAKAKAYRHEYNNRRPHSSLGYRTPAEYARSMKDAPPAC